MKMYAKVLLNQVHNMVLLNRNHQEPNIQQIGMG